MRYVYVKRLCMLFSLLQATLVSHLSFALRDQGHISICLFRIFQREGRFPSSDRNDDCESLLVFACAVLSCVFFVLKLYRLNRLLPVFQSIAYSHSPRRDSDLVK